MMHWDRKKGGPAPRKTGQEGLVRKESSYPIHGWEWDPSSHGWLRPLPDLRDKGRDLGRYALVGMLMGGCLVVWGSRHQIQLSTS